MPQPNDLSRSLAALEQHSTLIVVIEMSLSSWLVAGIVPGIERHPAKKLEPDEAALLRTRPVRLQLPTFSSKALRERTNCCVTGIGRDSLSGTESRGERCQWTGGLTHGLIANLLAAVLPTSA
jgi:hypothetical protein